MRLGKLLALNPNISKFEKDEVEFHNFAVLFGHLGNHAKTQEEEVQLQIKATICNTLSEICHQLQTIKTK